MLPCARVCIPYTQALTNTVRCSVLFVILFFPSYDWGCCFLQRFSLFLQHATWEGGGNESTVAQTHALVCLPSLFSRYCMNHACLCDIQLVRRTPSRMKQQKLNANVGACCCSLELALIGVRNIAGQSWRCGHSPQQRKDSGEDRGPLTSTPPKTGEHLSVAHSAMAA